DPVALRARFDGTRRTRDDAELTDHELDSVTSGSFESLPESIEVVRPNARNTVGFPALIHESGRVSLRVLGTPWEAGRSSRVGFAALFGECLAGDIRVRARRLPGYDAMAVHAAACGMSEGLESLVLMRAASVLCVDGRELPRTREAFLARREEAWDRAVPETQDTISLLRAVFAGLSGVRARLAAGLPEQWRHASADIEQQLRLLTPQGWAYTTPTRWLRCLPRYLNAIEIRLDRLRSVGAARDLTATREVYVWLEHLVTLARGGAERSEAVDDFELLRWMLEEYRVSRFAQELGTSLKVSEKAMRSQHERLLARLGSPGPKS
ncbi:MAG: DUF3418 domain-containing protein, partial [Planctomycetota bacterium]